MARRVDLIRVDDENNQKKVRAARKLILSQNHAISSEAVEAQLKASSLTPTDVSITTIFTRRLADPGF